MHENSPLRRDVVGRTSAPGFALESPLAIAQLSVEAGLASAAAVVVVVAAAVAVQFLDCLEPVVSEQSEAELEELAALVVAPSPLHSPLKSENATIFLALTVEQALVDPRLAL